MESYAGVEKYCVWNGKKKIKKLYMTDGCFGNRWIGKEISGRNLRWTGQKSCLARALAADKGILLLDEPLSNIDEKTN